jgi:glycosyltransferase involved in cell wall biosynthesis
VFHSQNTGPKWISRPNSKWQNYLRDFLLSWYLGKRVGAEANKDVVAVISNGPFGWYVPRTHPHIKRIHFYHGTYRGQAEAISKYISAAGAWKLKWWDSMLLERWSGRGKLVVCNSDQTREEVQRFFGYSATTVWLPLNTSHFAPMDKSSARKQLGIGEFEKIGLFVGSTHPMKGFSIVRELIDLSPDLKWLLALRGSAPVELRAPGRVRLFENAPYNLLPALYNAADFALFPSVYEPFGYVVAEALACGTPVVASPGGASRLFLGKPPLGFALIEKDAPVADYQRAIATILADPEMYRREVIASIRPQVESVMAPSNWLRLFREATGI